MGTQNKTVYTVEECTPMMENYETFAVCSTFNKAYEMKKLYAKNYPQNGYRISQHTMDDQRLIEMEK